MEDYYECLHHRKEVRPSPAPADTPRDPTRPSDPSLTRNFLLYHRLRGPRYSRPPTARPRPRSCERIPQPRAKYGIWACWTRRTTPRRCWGRARRGRQQYCDPNSVYIRLFSWEGVSSKRQCGGQNSIAIDLSAQLTAVIRCASECQLSALSLIHLFGGKHVFEQVTISTGAEHTGIDLNNWEGGMERFFPLNLPPVAVSLPCSLVALFSLALSANHSTTLISGAEGLVRSLMPPPKPTVSSSLWLATP